VLPAVVAAYVRKYPAVSVEVDLSDRKVDLLGEGVDLAIRTGALPDSSFIAKRLGTVQFAPYAAPAYLKLRGSPTQPKDLAQHALIGFTPLISQGLKLTNGRATTVVNVASRLRVSDLSLVRTLAICGEGIAFLPTFYCRQEVKAGKLERILPQWASVPRPVHFVYPAQRFISPKLKAFIEMASDKIAKYLQT
jgi:DNA-binding transcriptional LysR family regulator